MKAAIFAFLLSLPFILSAQPTPSICLDFDRITVGNYGPGNGNAVDETAFVSDSIPVSIIRFVSASSGPEFNDIEITNAPFADFSAATGNYISTNSSSLKFDFADFPGRVMGVTLDYHYSGGDFNLHYKNANYLFDSGNSLEESFRNVPNVEATETTTPSGKTGTLIFSEFVRDFGIGGENLKIDNVCIYMFKHCGIEEVIGNVINCDSAGYEIEVKFDVQNPGLQGLQIFHDGDLAGQFPYGQGSYVIGPFPHLSTTDHSVSVRDRHLRQQWICNEGYNISVNPDDCADNSNCGMSSVDMELLGFVTDSAVIRFNDFFGMNTSDSFNLYGNDFFHPQFQVGTFAYSDLPLDFKVSCELGPENFINLFICDAADPSCCSFVGTLGGGNDQWCDLASSAIDKNLQNQVVVHPNPSSGMLQVSLPENLQAENLALFDLTGRKINFDQISDTELSFSEHPTGIYFLKIETESGFAIKKIIKNE